MKHILFGGSFDPPHIGHLFKAQHARIMLNGKDIIFMISDQHPWGKKLTDWEDRMYMLEHSIEDLDMKDCFISAFEVGYKGLSTFEILPKFFEFEGDLNSDNTVYLIGSDQATLFHKWSHWKELSELLPFVVLARNKEDKIPDLFFKKPHTVIEDKTSTISSTQIRNVIAQGGNPVNLVTKNTLKYIKENELYVK